MRLTFVVSNPECKTILHPIANPKKTIMTNVEAFQALAWAMADLHEILPDTECAMSTSGEDDLFAFASFHTKGPCGEHLCDLIINHPEEQKAVLRVHLSADWTSALTKTVNYALSQMCQVHNIEYQEWISGPEKEEPVPPDEASNPE